MLFILPLNVNALQLKKSEQVIGQDMVFENIPWFNKKRAVFINPNTPFLTKSVIPRPFSYDNSITLEKGLHLHWNLPSLLKTIDKNGGLAQAPNRWYIKKEYDGKVLEWIIESDYVWDTDDPALDRTSTCTFPLADKNNLGEAYEFVYVGRRYTLQAWQESTYRKENYLDDFTSMGWGTLSFDLHYANSRSIFGFCDPATEIKEGTVFTVTGWYHHLEKDFIQEKSRSNFEELKGYINTLKKRNRFLDSETVIAYLKNKLIPDIDAIKNYLSQATKFDEDEFERFIKVYPSKIYNWEIKEGNPDSDSLMAVDGRIILFGQYQFEKNGLSTPDHSTNQDLSIAIGNTLPEALSSLILSDYKDDIEILKKEEQVEAVLNFDALNTLKLDWIPRLRNKRHENQFSVKTGTTAWELRRKDVVHTNSAEDKNDAIKPNIPPPLMNKLSELNANQSKLDLEKYKLFAAVENLYLDWYRYAETLFDAEKEPSLSEVRIYIEKKSLPQVYQLKRVVKDLEHIVDELKQDLIHQLQEKSLLDDFLLALKDTTRFYEPLPPGVVVSGKDNNTLLDIYSVADAGIICLFNESVDTLLSVNIEERSDWLYRLRQQLMQYDAATINAKTNNWRTYKVEWEALFMPNKRGHYLSETAGEFKTDFLTDTYILDEQNADLIKNYDLQNIAYQNISNVYYGASYVDNKVKDFVNFKLKAYQENQDSDTDFLSTTLSDFSEKASGIKLFELTLNDFNNAMVQRSAALSLMPYIPNGFENHQHLAKEIKAILETYKNHISLLIPNEKAVFNPFRNGAFTIERLRIIDCFGRDCSIKPTQISMPARQKIANKPDWVQLPPRIAQAATISVRWADTLTRINTPAKKKIRESSPVLGWLIPVYLTQRIEFFDAWGKHLGAFNVKGEWEFSPIDYFTASQEFDEKFSFIDNRDLRNMLRWFRTQLQKSSASFISAFINQVSIALEHIEPEAYQNPSLLETIATSPIAMTKVNMNLFTKTSALFDDGPDSFLDEVKNNTAKNDRKYTGVEIPVQLGDITQYNDGVIGYWHDSDISKNKGSIYFNNVSIIPNLSDYDSNRHTLEVLHQFLKHEHPAQEIHAFEKQFNASTGMLQVQKLMDQSVLGRLISAVAGKPSHIFKLQTMKETIATVLEQIRKFINEKQEIVPLLEKLIGLKHHEDDNFFAQNENIPGAFREFLLQHHFLKIEQSEDLPENKKLWLGDLDNTSAAFLKSIISEDKFRINKSQFLNNYLRDGNYYFNLLIKNGLVSKATTEHTGISFVENDRNAKVAINEHKSARIFITLMHPKGSLFVKSGLLPVKELKLPYEKIKNALKLIELTFITSPVLTPKRQLQLSLLKDKRYEWSWIELNKTIPGKKLSPSNLPIKKRITQNEAINFDLVPELKTVLLNNGFVHHIPPYPGEEIYFLNLEEISEFEHLQKGSERLDAEKLQAYHLLMSYRNQCLRIDDFNVSNSDIPELVLKEGWLSLKSTKY